MMHWSNESYSGIQKWIEGVMETSYDKPQELAGEIEKNSGCKGGWKY
jgi:hypothetical protein